jgi:hypothetical protein
MQLFAIIVFIKEEFFMAWDPNQGQPVGPNPNTDYGAPSNPYESPGSPYAAPQSSYGPPENPYGAPQNPFAVPPGQNYGNANAYNNQAGYMPPASTPLPLGEAVRQLPSQYIRVLTRPGAMTFAGEMSKAAWNIVWVQLVGYAVIATIFSFIGTQISSGLSTLGTGASSVNSSMLGSIRAIQVGTSLGSIIVVPLFFFIGMGILFGLSKAFHGQGRFVTQCYTFLLFSAPLGIIASIIGLIPLAGSVIAIAIEIYEIVLAIFAIQATHRLSGGKATAVVLIPVGVVLLLVCGLVVAIVAIVASSAQQFH